MECLELELNGVPMHRGARERLERLIHVIEPHVSFGEGYRYAPQMMGRAWRKSRLRIVGYQSFTSFTSIDPDHRIRNVELVAVRSEK